MTIHRINHFLKDSQKLLRNWSKSIRFVNVSETKKGNDIPSESPNLLNSLHSSTPTTARFVSNSLKDTTTSSNNLHLSLAEIPQLWIPENAHVIIQKTVVPFSLKHVFGIVSDVELYSSFLPFCSKSKITKKISSETFEAQLSIGYAPFSESYTSKVTAIPDIYVSAVNLDGSLFEFLANEWRLTSIEPNKSEIEFTVGYKFNHLNSLYNKVVPKTMEAIFPHFMDSFITKFHNS